MGKKHRKKFRNINILFVILIQVFFILHVERVTSAEDDSLGNMEWYNCMVMSDFSGLTAGIEGPVAIGGNAQFGTGTYGFDVGKGFNGYNSVLIGEQFTNPNKYPSLLLSGNVDSRSVRVSVDGGDFIVNTASTIPRLFRYDINNGNIKSESTEFVDSFFKQGKNFITKASSWLSKNNFSRNQITNFTSSQWKPQNFTKYDYDVVSGYKSIIINVNNRGSLNIGDLNFTSEMVNQADYIIINSNSSSATFTGGSILYEGKVVNTAAPRNSADNELLKKIAKKTIWNFTDATTVNIRHYGVIGAVIAPKAEIAGTGGSVEGTVFTNKIKLTSGFQLHYFPSSFWSNATLNEVLIKVHKTNNDKEDLADVHFGMEKLINNKYETVVGFAGKTNNEGIFTAGTLIVDGRYRLVELAPPKGHIQVLEPYLYFEITSQNKIYGFKLTDSLGNEVDSSYYRFLVEEPKFTLNESDILYISFKIRNEKSPILILTKIDKDTGEKLSGATFELRREDNRSILAPISVVGASVKISEDKTTLTLIDDGAKGENTGVIKILEGLLPVNYIIKEVNSPAGYIKNDINYNIKPVSGEETSIIIANEARKYSFSIEKIDSLSENVMPNVEFKLVPAKQGLMLPQTQITDSNGKATFTDLLAGTYKLIELTGDSNYLPIKDTIIQIPKDISSVYVVKNDPVPPIITPEPLFVGTIRLQKHDSQTAEGIRGVGFQLLQSKANEDVSQSIKFGQVRYTDQEGLIWFRDVPGNYTVTNPDDDTAVTYENFNYYLEELPNSDYNISEPNPKGPIQVTSNSSVTINGVLYPNVGVEGVELENTKHSQDVTLSKVDSEGNPIAEVEFELYKSNENHDIGELINSYVTVNELLVLHDLEAGYYCVIERKSAPGFMQDTEPRFFRISTENQEKIVFNVINNRNYATVLLIKYDSDTKDKYLSGAVYSLHKYDDATKQVGEFITEVTTDDSGEATLDNLEMGEYCFVEKTPPEGYAIDTTPIVFSITESTVIELVRAYDSVAVPEESYEPTEKPIIRPSETPIDTPIESPFETTDRQPETPMPAITPTVTPTTTPTTIPTTTPTTIPTTTPTTIPTPMLSNEPTDGLENVSNEDDIQRDSRPTEEEEEEEESSRNVGGADIPATTDENYVNFDNDNDPLSRGKEKNNPGTDDDSYLLILFGVEMSIVIIIFVIRRIKKNKYKLGGKR